MDNERITVSLPYYRCREYVRRAVEGILAQTYSDLRLVVVNDGDRDPPWRELAGIRDPRLILFSLDANHGCYFAHQVLLEATEDPWFAFQDADDWSEPRRLERLLHTIRSEQSDGAVSAVLHHVPAGELAATQLERHPDFSRPLGAELDHRSALRGLFKTESLRDIGGCYGGFRIGYDTLLINLLLMSARVSYVDEPLYHRFVRKGSLTTNEQSGLGSPERMRVHKKLRSIYARAYQRHAEFRAGRISRDELCETIRAACARGAGRRERNAILREAAGLKLAMASAPTTALHKRVPVDPGTPGCVEPQYRAASFLTFPFGSESYLVYSSSARRIHCLPKTTVEALSLCREMDTLGNHALARCHREQIRAYFGDSVPANHTLRGRILQSLRGYAERHRQVLRLDPGRLSAAAAEISELAHLGLMISEPDLLEGIQRTRESSPPPIDTIGIATRDRPQCLRTALESCLEMLLSSARPPACVIVDASGPDESKNVMALLGNVQASFGANLRYAGEAERTSYAKAVADASGLEPQAVEFALLGEPRCPVTTGASRNALLLDSAGEISLQVDDDSVCRLVDPLESESGLAFSSDPDPTEFWFFESCESLAKTLQLRDGDLLSLHESLLGRDLAGCIESNEAGYRLDLRRSLPRHDDLLLSGRARVLVTCAGVAGDSGIGATGYFFIDAASRRRLTRSEEFYRAVVESRQVVRTVRKATVSPGAGFLSFNLGLDHRELLPPFTPVMRGSDAVFSALLRQAFPCACTGFLPACLLHQPPGVRTQTWDKLWEELGYTSFSGLLLLAIRSCPEFLGSEAPRERLRQIGSHLIRIASAPTEDLEEFLRLQAWRSTCEVLDQIEGVLQGSANEGDFLRNYQRRYLRIARQALQRPDYVVPRDLVQCVGFDHARELFRQLIGRFGELLQIWPAMVEAANVLRARGVRLGRSISGRRSD